MSLFSLNHPRSLISHTAEFKVLTVAHEALTSAPPPSPPRHPQLPAQPHFFLLSPLLRSSHRGLLTVPPTREAQPGLGPLH